MSCTDQNAAYLITSHMRYLSSSHIYIETSKTPSVSNSHTLTTQMNNSLFTGNQTVAPTPRSEARSRCPSLKISIFPENLIIIQLHHAGHHVAPSPPVTRTLLLPPRPRPRRAFALPGLPFPPFVGILSGKARYMTNIPRRRHALSAGAFSGTFRKRLADPFIARSLVEECRFRRWL